MQLFSEQECRTRSGSEEAVLIGRILAGRKDLFDELLKPHLAPLWRVVQAKIGTDTDVEDVVQQTAESLPAPGTVSERGSIQHVADSDCSS